MAKEKTGPVRGSLQRCLLLTGKASQETAAILTETVNLAEFKVSDSDRWKPNGFKDKQESRLVDDFTFLTEEQRDSMLDYWLKIIRRANVPNWDIASVCAIEGLRGILLVEAKAHNTELSEAGKNPPSTPNGILNHCQIGKAIEQANTGLDLSFRGTWALTRDSHYQISNRFAWAWKLASIGVPTVLVYLGFLNALEMQDRGQYFASHQQWENYLLNHCANMIPADVWGKRLVVKGTPLWFLIRSIEIQSK